MTSTTAPTLGGLPLPLELPAPLAAGPGGASAPAQGAAGAARARAKATAAPSKAAAKPAAKATAKKTTTKKAAGKGATAKAAGYATSLPADYAFLRDPKLSIEEKLSRFIGMLMAKSEQDLLRQMEKMAPGSTAAAAGAKGAAASGGAAKPKAPKFSLWGIAKQLLPPLGLASQLIGDAQLKKLATQVSGPVLAAAATAVGLPALAPLAAKLGPSLVGALTKDITADLTALVGGASAGAAGGGAAPGASSGAAAGGAAKAGGEGSTSEKAQLMELQRLQDRDKELFALFSNMLRAMHDSRMTAIQNIR